MNRRMPQLQLTTCFCVGACLCVSAMFMTWIHETDESTNLCLFTPTRVSWFYLHAVISTSAQVPSPNTRDFLSADVMSRMSY